MNTSIDQTPAAQPKLTISSAWRRGAIGVSLVAGGFVLGAVSLASAGGSMPWQGDHHGPRIGMIQHVVHGALENVGATSAQETKIHDIIAATYTDLDQGKSEREALRKQVLDLMRAPTIDRAAVEKLRADQIASLDAKSKKVVGAVLDAASQLTPDQRTKLADHLEERMAHRGWGGHHEGPMGDHGGPAHDGGPDHGGDDDHGDHG